MCIDMYREVGAEMNPIEQLFDGVTWKEIPAPAEQDELPYATHEGVVEFAGCSLRCYRLNTGEAIFNSDDLMEFFEGGGSRDE